jgi:asparagine synthase (glutamine-hydrolysing)
MCGIWLYLNNNENEIEKIKNKYSQYYNKLQPRGPDMTRIEHYDNILMVFHRLAINDLNQDACMPFELNDVVLICNGEIYNHNELISKNNFKMKTTCDCEVILHLYNKLLQKYNTHKTYSKIIDKLCNELDGEYSFLIYDRNNKILFTARDEYGVRPLFIGLKTNNKHNLLTNNIYDSIMFSSEYKGINDGEFITSQFNSGHYAIFDTKTLKLIDYDLYRNDITKYFENDFIEIPTHTILKDIREKLEKAVEKRVKNTDRKIACLLSGGLDSSLICAIASKYFEPYELETYSIGLKNSPDLINAKKVAQHIKSKHTEIIVTETHMLNTIEDVIKTIESYDITTIRASVVNYLLAHYISKNSEAKVILSGEYADEVFLSYIYCKYIKNPEIFYKEEARLIDEIQFYDSLRADRCICSASLEARVPFSDKTFIDYIMSINPKLKMACNNNNIEKYLLRKAFDDGKTLPYEILWRTKEAFSDGISKKEKSWYEILQEYIDTIISDEEFEINKNKFTNVTIPNKEAYYYMKIFKKYYNNEAIIPYYWLPKKVNEYNQLVNFTTEPSARILQDIYE